jgi:hypothetical protein
MVNTKLSLLAAVIISAMHTGYRRAGIAFDKGENTVDVDETQLLQIEQDSNLLVQSATPFEPNTDNSTQGDVDAGSVGDVTIDLTNAPQALNAIIAAIHAKQCQAPLAKKPNCDEFGGLKVSGDERDAAWAWYQDNVINHVPG